MARADTTTPEGRARRRAKAFSALAWHAGAFVVVNAFLWIQDVAAGGGLEYAYWTTIPWGVGLAFHALAFILADRGLEERKYRQYLEEERTKEPQGS